MPTAAGSASSRSVHDGDTTLGYFNGYDRAANADAPLYLSLLQSTVPDAIAFGSSRLSLGRTAEHDEPPERSPFKAALTDAA